MSIFDKLNMGGGNQTVQQNGEQTFIFSALPESLDELRALPEAALSTPFQAGLLLFTLICTLLSFGYINSLFMKTQKNMELQSELAILERSIDAQKEKNNLLLEHAEEVRRQRHDLRQHMNVIVSALEAGKYEEVKAYARELNAQIPIKSDVVWCEHPVANALLSYYVSTAEKAGAACTVRAQIPAYLPHISDGSLCILIGNLLENAVEACGRMDKGRRCLDFRARVQGDMLSVTLDNSYNGEVRFNRGRYLSSKRGEAGIGLRSVESVAKRHGGAAVFESAGTVFHSSVYIRM